MSIVKRLLAIFVCTQVMVLAQAQEQQFELAKKRRAGLVKALFTKPHPTKLEESQVFIRLFGALDRDSCAIIRLKDKDNASLEIIKLAITLNQPLRVVYATEANDPDFRCELQSVGLDPR